MNGLAEELALERLAAQELEEEAGLLWQRGMFGAAREAQAAARAARAHVIELEKEHGDG